MPTFNEYLFVYGTLRRAFVETCAAPQLAALMKPLSYVGSGMISGELYNLGEYPGAIIGNDFKTFVHGEIYLLPDPTEILAALDVYEGFIPGELEASLFARISAAVTLPDQSQLLCWMYVYNDWVLQGRLIESGDYLKDQSSFMNNFS